MTTTRRTPRDVLALSALFAGAGVLHFARPGLFEPIVPKALPGKRELVYASGAAEIACAVGLLRPSTRHWAGWASVALLAAVYPANIQMASSVLRSPRTSRTYKVGVVARLPLQLPLVATALKAARSDR